MNRFDELRKTLDTYTWFVWQAVKDGRTSGLPQEAQDLAKAIQEHIDLPGVYNALEFADVREGQPYVMDMGGEPLSPMAHIDMHAAILSVLRQNGDAQAAFEALRKEEQIDEHHAIHVLAGLFMGFWWIEGRKSDGLPTPLEGDEAYILKGDFAYALRRICTEPDYRRNLVEKFPAAHWDEPQKQQE